MCYRLLANIPAMLIGLLFGARSDTRGRKLPMIVPSTGSCLAIVVYVVSTQVRKWKSNLLLLGAACQGMFGKSPVIAMAVNR